MPAELKQYKLKMVPLTPSSNDVIELVFSYIHTHAIASPGKLKISLLSRQFGIGKDVLKIKFKSRYNITIRKLIIRVRMEEAQKILLNSSISVCEVAYTLGYNDVSNFSRDFKRYSKVNPKDLRSIYVYQQKKIQIVSGEIFNQDFSKRL